MRKIKRFSTVAGCACMAAIVLLSLIPGADRPRTGLSDFSENVLAYFGTAFLFTLGISGRHGRMLIVPGLLVCSITTETMQHFIPGRVSSVLDVIANGVGAAAGTAGAASLMGLAVAIWRRWCGRGRNRAA